MLYALFCTPAYYEEVSSTDYLIATLPISKNDYVLSKYITLLIEMVLSLIYSLILFIVSMSLAKISLSSSDILTFICLCLVIGLLYISIIVPVVLKWGFANIRYVFIFIAIGGAILASSGSVIIKTPTIQNLLNNTSVLILIIFIIISIIFITSIFISIWIYNKKELLQ
ncbi:MAG: ABC-2 transporter permease [Sarcina sp.]